jgi:hypothetical protein
VVLRWREERETVDGWLGNRVRRRILPSEVWDVTTALREAFAEPPDRRRGNIVRSHSSRARRSRNISAGSRFSTSRDSGPSCSGAARCGAA